MNHRPAGHRYSAWNRLRGHVALEPDELLETLGDRFLNEDTGQVLSDVLHRGLATDEGASLAGIDEIRSSIRQQLQGLDTDLLKAGLDEMRHGHAAGSEGLSPDAGDLLDMMAASPMRAGRLFGGASPGTRDELTQLRDSAGPLQAKSQLGSLLDLASLEHDLRRVRSVADVDAISLEQIADALGEDLASRFAGLARTLTDFREHGYVDLQESELKPRALRQLGMGLLRGALIDIESRLAGDHDARRSATGFERGDTTREYRYGDPFDLDLSGTVLQAVRRQPGTPVRLSPRDMTIFEREETGRVATLLAIDRSRSMGERGYLLAAKRLALALATLIRTRFPRDRLELLAFSSEAQPISVPDLVKLEWDRFAVGTNIHDALAAGRRKLAEAAGLQRTLILITDGEPTAYRDGSGEVSYSEPPAPEALAATYAQARRLRREQILLVVALLSVQRQVVNFAGELARQAEGQIVLAEPDDLSAALLMGYGQIRRN